MAGFRRRGANRTIDSPLFILCDARLLGRFSLRQTALVTRGRVSVNQPLSRGSVQKGDGAERHFGRGVFILRLLERRAKSGALSAVAHGRRTGLPHVLFRGRNIRHGKDSNRAVFSCWLRALNPIGTLGACQAKTALSDSGHPRRVKTSRCCSQTNPLMVPLQVVGRGRSKYAFW